MAASKTSRPSRRSTPSPRKSTVAPRPSARTRRQSTAAQRATRTTTPAPTTSQPSTPDARANRTPDVRANRTPISDSLSGLTEQLVNRILEPLGLVILSRERIHETLDEAAERGRVTRSDANELARLLVQRGRQQTDELLSDIERLLGRGRQQLDPTTLKARSLESVDRLVRKADRARRTVRVGPTFPIIGYDRLTARQVQQRLGNLNPAEVRKVRDYERRHANRKSVLSAIEKRLG